MARTVAGGKAGARRRGFVEAFDVGNGAVRAHLPQLLDGRPLGVQLKARGAGACNELPRWNRAGGRVWRGLTNRRLSERAMCHAALQGVT